MLSPSQVSVFVFFVKNLESFTCYSSIIVHCFTTKYKGQKYKITQKQMKVLRKTEKKKTCIRHIRHLGPTEFKSISLV